MHASVVAIQGATGSGMDYRLRDGLEEKDGMLSSAQVDLCCVSCRSGSGRVESSRVDLSRAESREEEARIKVRRAIRDGVSAVLFPCTFMKGRAPIATVGAICLYCGRCAIPWALSMCLAKLLDSVTRIPDNVSSWCKLRIEHGCAVTLVAG